MPYIKKKSITVEDLLYKENEYLKNIVSFLQEQNKNLLLQIFNFNSLSAQSDESIKENKMSESLNNHFRDIMGLSNDTENIGENEEQGLVNE